MTLTRLRTRLGQESGQISLLAIGLFVVVMLVIATGVAATGVHLDRKELQSIADGAALHASSAISEPALYDAQDADDDVDEASRDLPVSVETVREAPENYLDRYRLPGHSNLRGLHVSEVTVTRGTMANIELAARTDPPLISWLTRAFDAGISISVRSSAQAV